MTRFLTYIFIVSAAMLMTAGCNGSGSKLGPAEVVEAFPASQTQHSRSSPTGVYTTPWLQASIHHLRGPSPAQGSGLRAHLYITEGPSE